MRESRITLFYFREILMKTPVIGCTGALIGLVVGILLTFAVNLFTPIGARVAPLDSSQADVTITASAAFVNSQLPAFVKQTGLVKQATLNFMPPNLARIAATTDVSLFGQRIAINAMVTMQMRVENGRVVLTIDQVQAGGLNVPQSFANGFAENYRAQAEEQINRALTRALPGMSLRLISIATAQDEITARFKLAP
jgi:hypothetical protein